MNTERSAFTGISSDYSAVNAPLPGCSRRLPMAVGRGLARRYLMLNADI
ncbi:MAG: hypothetical protein KGZ70_09780 [Hydrogenophaga sp.]|nr:hypothetical protein [Hydrogenophaga sp.]MBS3912097.1 hypothetical protein [Hydrogenophaga sp.]